MKLRLPIWDRRLRPALCLAFVSMVVTVGLVTLVGMWLLGLPPGAPVLLGAILAPAVIVNADRPVGKQAAAIAMEAGR